MIVESSNGRATGHVSRVAITNSREDLTSVSRTLSPDLPSPKIVGSVLHKKSVTKINIGSGFTPDPPAEIEHSRSTSVDAQGPLPKDIPEPEPEHVQPVKPVDNNNVIQKTQQYQQPQQTKARSISTSSSGGQVDPVNLSGGHGNLSSGHALVDKRHSNSSSTTTSLSKTSSANLSGSYHHLHHLSQVRSCNF